MDERNAEGLPGAVSRPGASASNGKGHKTILWGILAGVIAGILVGGIAPPDAKAPAAPEQVRPEGVPTGEEIIPPPRQPKPRPFGKAVAAFLAVSALFGTIFLKALKMIVVPLVMLSMITGISSLGNVRHIGAIGWRTLVYYLLTTGMSVLLGLVMVNIFRPGRGVVPGENLGDASYKITGKDAHTVVLTGKERWLKSYDLDWSLVLHDQEIDGKAIHGAIVRKVDDRTLVVKRWEDPRADVFIKAKDGTVVAFRHDEDGKLVSVEPRLRREGKGLITRPEPRRVRGKEKRGVGDTLREVVVGLVPANIFRSMVEMDILPLIVFSLLFGAALSTLGDLGKGTIEVFSALNEVVMRMVWWLMIFAPIGIFGLIVDRMNTAGGFPGFWPQLVALGQYSLTVIIGLFLHAFVTLSLVLWLLGKRNPLIFMVRMGPALLNAFSTASSSATLPLTMEGVEKENGISNRTASFVLPLGATINMDGTALYEAVAAMFIAQIYGISLGLNQQVIIFLTATVAAIGAAGIPEARLVTMVIVLNAVHLPVEGIGVILAIDWFLERCRTTVNVWGDSVGAAVIDRMEGNLGGAAQDGG